jgi:hypothetical protein
VCTGEEFVNCHVTEKNSVRRRSLIDKCVTGGWTDRRVSDVLPLFHCLNSFGSFPNQHPRRSVKVGVPTLMEIKIAVVTSKDGNRRFFQYAGTLYQTTRCHHTQELTVTSLSTITSVLFKGNQGQVHLQSFFACDVIRYAIQSRLYCKQVFKRKLTYKTNFRITCYVGNVKSTGVGMHF